MFIKLTDKDDAPILVNLYALDYVETNFEGECVLVLDEERRVVKESIEQIEEKIAVVNY